jgi:hypothetical protein
LPDARRGSQADDGGAGADPVTSGAALGAAPGDALVCNAREHGLTGDGAANDQPALAELVDALGAASAADGRGRVIYCPPGVYAIRDAGTVWRSRVSLIGAGAGATRFVLSNPGNPSDPAPLAFFTAAQHGAGRENHVADVTFADFEIDGSGVTLPKYDPLAKGLGLQYVVRGRFRDLYIHDTGGTGFGCDFLQDTLVSGVVTANCGRLDDGADMGGAGIGIGIGGWGLAERLTISGCTSVGSGTNGIFVELQKETWPPPRGIVITGCHVEHNRFGISDWGAQGLLVSACSIVGNLEAGFDVSSQGTTSVGGRGGMLTGCLIDSNVRDGVSIGNTPGPYTVRGNRISGNGRYGYREHNLQGGDEEPAKEIVLDGNDVWGNGLDGIRIEAALTDAVLHANRVRNNGRRCAPAAAGGGDGVTYGACSLRDASAAWPRDGHMGKPLRVGARTATVTGNTETELQLAPARPAARSAWLGEPPPAGAAYELPAAPALRAGVTIDAATERPTLRANRVWDNQDAKTQTHGLWITERGGCTAGRITDNDLVGNADAASHFETPPRGGFWHGNFGVNAVI